MRSMRRVWAVMGLGMALVLAVATGGAAQSPLPAPDPASGRLAEAYWFLPPGGTDVAFTDWDRIRASQGATDITGSSSLDDKMAVVMSTNHDEAATSGFALNHLRTHHDVWGFDSFDLDWEATYSVDGPPVYVLRFRDGFDLAPLVALFDDRGFSTTQVDGAVIRSHAVDVAADWLHATEFAILNTAFLDDGRTLVLSSGLEGVTDVLATRGMPRPLMPGLTPVLGALDGASAAWISVGSGTCLAFSPPPVDPGDPTATLQPMPSQLAPYTIMGVGYARPDWDPTGRIVFGYPDPTLAAATLDARAERARTGISVVADQPYAEVAFTLEDAHADGAANILDVAPADDMPRRLFDMVFRRDMTFAGC